MEGPPVWSRRDHTGNWTGALSSSPFVAVHRRRHLGIRRRRPDEPRPIGRCTHRRGAGLRSTVECVSCRCRTPSKAISRRFVRAPEAMGCARQVGDHDAHTDKSGQVSSPWRPRDPTRSRPVVHGGGRSGGGGGCSRDDRVRRRTPPAMSPKRCAGRDGALVAGGRGLSDGTPYPTGRRLKAPTALPEGKGGCGVATTGKEYNEQEAMRTYCSKTPGCRLRRCVRLAGATLRSCAGRAHLAGSAADRGHPELPPAEAVATAGALGWTRRGW